ncbi:MAG: radical SAM protein [Pseudomonadota bacterium]
MRLVTTKSSGSCAVEFIEVDLSTRCNFNCVYCYGRRINAVDLDPETFKMAIESFPEVKYLEMHGEGEPLLHPQFFELSDYARKRRIKCSLFTNGSLLDDEMVECILDADLEKIVVSIDTADPKRFQLVRGGSLEQVYEGIKKLVQSRKKKNLSKPAVGLAVTVFRDFVEDFKGVVSLYRDLGLDGGIGYQPLNSATPYRLGYSSEWDTQIMSLKELEQTVLPLKSDPAVEMAIDGTSVYRGFFDELFDPLKRGERVCPWLKRGLYLTATGQLTPCCMIKEDFSMGRIGEVSLEDVLRQKHELHQKLEEKVVPIQCKECEIAALVVGSPGNVMEPIQTITTDAPTKNIEHREENIRQLETTIANLKAEREAIYGSKSWRITAPLRRALDIINRWYLRRSRLA